MSRINRRDFSRLAQSGGHISVNRMPAPLVRQLAQHGVGRDALTRIAGRDHVISGAEFNRLYDALAVRSSGGRSVDSHVSAALFQSLEARVERAGGNPEAALSNGSAGRSVGIGRAATARPGADATVATGAGAGNIENAADIEGRADGQRPNAFVSALESIAEFFVELFGGNYVTSAENDFDVGRQIANEHPETLRAVLAEPDGADQLRDRLDAQRPAGTSNSDWSRTVKDVMRGITGTLNGGAPDLPDDVNPVASLAVRDEAARLYAADSSAAARAELAATVDAVSQSGLSEATQVAMLTQWGASGRPRALRSQLEAFTQHAANLSPAVRAEAFVQLDSHPDRLPQISAALGTLTANPGFGRVSPQVQRKYLAMMSGPNANGAAARAALARLEGAHDTPLAGLNDVLFSSGTLAAGAQGAEVTTIQRYLRALGYDGVMGSIESSSFDANTQAAVTEFQRRSGLLDGNPPAATAGVVNTATLNALYSRVRAEGIDPLDYRFTTALSLNRPTSANDRAWRATQRWTPELEAEFGQFAHAYAQARVPQNPGGVTRRAEWAERVDCADLSYEALCQFARQRGLPVYLGSARHSNRGAGQVTNNMRSNLGAMHLQQFTRPLARGESPRTGDIGNMDWDQSVGDGHDSRYWHAHNIVEFDPLFREATVIFGSLDDLVRERPLQRFNQRGFDLTIHDIPEVQIIDAINDDTGGGRQRGRADQERAVRALLGRHTAGGHQVTDADVNAFITMVGNDSNLRRNAPTAVANRSGSFQGLVQGTPWADPVARTTAVADLNRRFGASFTEGDIDRLVRAGNRPRVEAEAARLVGARVPVANRTGATVALITAARGTVHFNANRDALSDRGARATAVQTFNQTYASRVTDADVRSVLRAGAPGADLRAAEDIVRRRGVPEDRRADAARALVDAADGTRRFRRWDFEMFNRHM